MPFFQQSADDRVHLFCPQDKIPADRSPPAADRLKVDRGCRTHGRRDIHVHIFDRLGTRDRELVNAIGVFSGLS
jgi:hypothetical protein